MICRHIKILLADVEGIVYRDTSDERGSCGKIEDVKNGLDQENQTYRLYCNNRFVQSNLNKSFSFLQLL